MKKRRVTTIAMIIAMLLTAPVTGMPALAARTPSDWAIPEMNDANTSGLLTHSAARDFHAHLTRDEFCETVVTLVERTLGRALPVPPNNPFYDCESIYVLKAWNYGVITGVTTTRFAPEREVERQQLCVMMIRAIRQLEKDLGKSLLDPGAQALTYNDSYQIEDYAVEAVKLALTNDIMRGDEKNNFNPRAGMESQVCMAVIIRSFNRMERSIIAGMPTSKLLDLAEERVNIGFAYGDTADGVSQNITLPQSSTGGAAVSWASSNNAVISPSGTVMQGNGGQTVTMTASISLGGQSRTKHFILRTSLYSGDQALMENAYNALDIIYTNAGDSAGSVTGRVGLPSKILGLTVTWSSSNPGVVSNTGAVNAPGLNEPAAAMLTAVIANGSITRIKTFNLTVVSSAYGRGVTLHGVQFGMSQSQVATLLGAPIRTVQAGVDEVWHLFHNNYNNFIAVAFAGNRAAAVYSMAQGASGQLRNSAGSVITVAQANAMSGVGAVSYSDNSQQFALMVYDSGTPIGSARALYADGQEQLLFELVNAFRQRNGRPALIWTEKLGTPSRDHSDEMGQFNYLGVTSRNGRSLQQLASERGFDRSRYSSGNVLAGENDAFDFFGKMAGTPTMRSNVVATGITVFGAGFSGGNTGSYRNYLTYMFGSLNEIAWISATQQGVQGTVSTVFVSPNTTVIVTISISPAGYNESFTVTSSNNYVMTVSNNATTIRVTGRTPGEADIVITGSSSGNVFTIPVVVDTVYASGLSLSYSGEAGTRKLTDSARNEMSSVEIVLGVRESITLSAATGVSGAAVVWTHSGGAAAAVNANGVVTAGNAPGTITVTATVETGPTYSLAHSVVINVVELTVTAQKNPIEAHETTMARAALNSAAVSGIRDVPEYLWDSSNQNAATLSNPDVTMSIANIRVNGANIGAATATSKISASALWNTDKYLGSVTGFVNIDVKAEPNAPTEIVLEAQGAAIIDDELTVNIYDSRSLQLSATVLPASANEKAVIWSSGDKNIAVVDGDGLVAFLAEGVVTITATSLAQPGVKGAVEITVVLIPTYY